MANPKVDWNKNTKKDKIVKFNTGKNIRKAGTQVNREKSIQRLKTDEDTIIRTEVHGIILKGLKEGKSNEEVLKLLTNSRYDKYRQYFPIWISDRQKR